jgi:hypothetical protein
MTFYYDTLGLQLDIIAVLDSGLDINSFIKGAPLLHWAVYYGLFDVASSLLQRGANVGFEFDSIRENERIPISLYFSYTKKL